MFVCFVGWLGENGVSFQEGSVEDVFKEISFGVFLDRKMDLSGVFVLQKSKKERKRKEEKKEKKKKKEKRKEPSSLV